MHKLIVIPARGGSKGIPQKNIYPLLGKPLLEYTIEVILKARLKDTDCVVSTDSEDIKNIAIKYKEIIVVDRPVELSGDSASTEDALLHSLEVMEEKTGKKYGAIMTMQPTSPLRKVDTLRDFVEKYENNTNNIDALVSLSETRSDYWVCRDGKYGRLYPNAPRRRQDRSPLFVENSAYYITSTDALRETHSVLGKKVDGFIISEIEGIDINELVDIKMAEAFLEQVSF